MTDPSANSNSLTAHRPTGESAPKRIRLNQVGAFLSAVAILCSCYQMRMPRQEAADKIRDTAMSYVGVPYRYGGMNRNGIDCSGLIVRIYQEALGISLPHSTNALFRRGKPVLQRELRTGDLVFFRYSRDVVDHVGLVLERNRFIHASTTGVTVSSLDAAYYRNRFAGARRLLQYSIHSAQAPQSGSRSIPGQRDSDSRLLFESDPDVERTPLQTDRSVQGIVILEKESILRSL